MEDMSRKPQQALSLERAREEGRLDEFIRQQERWENEHDYRGADADELEDGLKAHATAPPPEDRT